MNKNYKIIIKFKINISNFILIIFNLSMEPKYDLKILQDYKILDYSPFTNTEDFDFVYRPNDDTFLFLDALKLDYEKNRPSSHDIIIEIG